MYRLPVLTHLKKMCTGRTPSALGERRGIFDYYEKGLVTKIIHVDDDDLREQPESTEKTTTQSDSSNEKPYCTVKLAAFVT
jgi:hypothetical protein